MFHLTNSNHYDKSWGGAIELIDGITNALSKINIFSNFNQEDGSEINIIDQSNYFKVVKLDSIYYGTTNVDKINSINLAYIHQNNGM